MPRFKRRMPLHVSDVTGFTCDIGPGGLCLESSSSFLLGEILNVRVCAESVVHDLCGVVQWSRHLPESNEGEMSFRCGLRFLAAGEEWFALCLEEHQRRITADLVDSLPLPVGED
ncbi:hypothetical protein ACFL6C_04745 [Myxococcota bacterium]